MMYKTRLFSIVILLHFTTALFANAKADQAPNVIFILTDDQGIGDLSCHGNPWIKTPNLDKLYNQSVRMTDFHVSPYCAPTRSALMTGKYPINNGVWATYKGRDAMTEGTTLADVFKQNGYKTGMFGKWHLGDNYPVRPIDCGFDLAIQHKAGGVGELSDYWGNSYFDDVYFVNEKAEKFEGYCTDIWFNQTTKFINENKDKPFFIYLATNAPHSPWIVDNKYSNPYKQLEKDKKIVSADFYGMIANLDENIGKLEKFLRKNDLIDNTILIFMTDNGSSGGISRDGKIGYNKGFRGMKGGKTEGGHRVPFFIRWPNGKIKGGVDINQLTAHVDILPTLISLCKLNVCDSIRFDGLDISSILQKEEENLDHRTVFVHHRQDWRPPMDVKQTCVLNKKWRLKNGNELYNVKNDKYQKNNLLKQYPKIVKTLLNSNENFVKTAKTKSEYQQLPVNVIGNKNQKEIKLTIQHAIGEDKGIWKCEQVAQGMKNTNNTHSIRIDRSAWYEISCCRWPKECPGPVWGIPEKNPKNLYSYSTIKPEKVRISIANKILEKKIKGDEEAVVFKVKLEKGKTFLVNDFIEGKQKYGVYYTYIKSIN